MGRLSRLRASPLKAGSRLKVCPTKAWNQLLAGQLRKLSDIGAFACAAEFCTSLRSRIGDHLRPSAAHCKFFSTSQIARIERRLWTLKVAADFGSREEDRRSGTAGFAGWHSRKTGGFAATGRPQKTMVYPTRTRFFIAIFVRNATSTPLKKRHLLAIASRQTT